MGDAFQTLPYCLHLLEDGNRTVIFTRKPGARNRYYVIAQVTGTVSDLKVVEMEASELRGFPPSARFADDSDVRMVIRCSQGTDLRKWLSQLQALEEVGGLDIVQRVVDEFVQDADHPLGSPPI